MFYKSILRPERRRHTTLPGRSITQEFLSDRSRIIYSNSFRRLQQKAQVFSLEENPGVRVC